MRMVLCSYHVDARRGFVSLNARLGPRGQGKEKNGKRGGRGGWEGGGGEERNQHTPKAKKSVMPIDPK